MNIFKNLFKSKLGKFQDEATRLIMSGNYTQLRVLSLDLREYIANNKANWSKNKLKEYQDLLDDILETI